LEDIVLEVAAALDVGALARGLLEALAHIHDAGIVHRDVKPGNILLGTDGRARLTDFGIAQPEDATQLTQAGLVLGTLKYLAPEVLQGKPATAASDLYAAGVVLREASGVDPRPPLTHLIDALTAVRPEQRPNSASAAIELLHGATAAGPPRTTEATRVLDPTTAAQVAQTAPRKREISRRMLLAGLATAAVLVIIVISLSSGGGTGSANTSGNRAPPAVPASSAPLQRQLQALGQIVDHAAGR